MALESMLDHDAVIDAQTLVSVCGSTGDTDDRALQALRFILHRRPELDLNARSSAASASVNGPPQTALQAACVANNWPVVLFLLTKAAVATGLELFLAVSSPEPVSVQKSSDAGLLGTNQRQRGRLAAINSLLEHGADLNWRDPVPRGCSVLEAACASRDSCVTQLLIQRGAVISNKAVVLACNGCDAATFDGLLYGAGIDGNALIEQSVFRCVIRRITATEDMRLVYVACRCACETGRQDIAVHLIKRGFLPTPSHIFEVAGADRAELLEEMLDAGTAVDLRGINGLTAMEILSKGYPASSTLFHRDVSNSLDSSTTGIGKPVAAILVRRGANVADPSQLLVAACFRGDQELARALINRFCAVGLGDRADIIAAVNALPSIMTDACRYGHSELALALVEGGFAFSIIDFCMACESRDLDLVRAMLDRGADVERTGGMKLAGEPKSERKALHRASQRKPLQLACQEPNFRCMTSPVIHCRSRAAESGVALLLVERGAEIKPETFVAALRNCTDEVIFAMLDRGAGAHDSRYPTMLEFVASRRALLSPALVSRLVSSDDVVTHGTVLTAIQSRGSLDGIRALLQSLQGAPSRGLTGSNFRLTSPSSSSAAASTSSAPSSVGDASAVDAAILHRCVTQHPTALSVLLECGAVPSAGIIYEAFRPTFKRKSRKMLDLLLGAASAEVRCAALAQLWPYEHNRRFCRTSAWH